MSSLALALLLIGALGLGADGPAPPPDPSLASSPPLSKFEVVPDQPPSSLEPFVARATLVLLPYPEVGVAITPAEQDERDRPTPLEQAVARKDLKQLRFESTAQFPLPRFGIMGEPLCGEGVVIYEGMRLVVARDGRYEVSFTATTPAMPVTLRLQLVFCSKSKNSHETLTLPPIRIVPARDFHGNYLGAAWFVRQSGYCAQMREPVRDSLGEFTVTRQGTARFGSWPEGINEFNRLSR